MPLLFYACLVAQNHLPIGHRECENGSLGLGLLHKHRFTLLGQV